MNKKPLSARRNQTGKQPDKLVQTSCYFEDKQMDDLVLLERETGIKSSVHVRLALRQYLGRELPKVQKNMPLANAIKGAHLS